VRGQLVERTEKDYRAFVRRWEADGQPPPAEWVKTMSSPATPRNARAALIWWHRVELGKTLDIPWVSDPSVYRPPTRRRSWRCFATRLMGFVAFRVFTPNEVFPVTYRRGRAAHLDVGGRRGDAIRTAVHDQLRLTVLEAKPVGARGVGGLHAAPAPGRRSRQATGAIPLRQALREEPRARRPLVQAGSDDPLRGARGRGALPIGAPDR
jgi:hypothetical protein